MSDPDSKKSKKDWNAMFYLAGENNLADECVFALKELRRARPRSKDNRHTIAMDEAADARVKVVAQLDAGGLGGDEVRYILTRNSEDEDGELENAADERVDTTQTNYRGVLRDFISSSIVEKEGHAKHYLLVLSGHGNGLISDFLSRDTDSPDYLSIPKIRWVLQEVKQDVIKEFTKENVKDFKIDILGLDSCMMSMAEIGYELRDYVKYMVAAEGFEPNSGWPYERILSALLTDSDTIEPEEFAVRIVDRYVNYYTDFLPAARSVDLSACDLSKCEDLGGAIKEPVDAMCVRISNLDDADAAIAAANKETLRQIVLAHWEAQSYKDDQYVDLYDFCDLLDRGWKEDPDPKKTETGSVVMRGVEVADDIRNACSKIKNILTSNGKNGKKNGGNSYGDKMILKSRHSGPAVQYSHGLSVYFPWANVIESYGDLEFAKNTHWKQFLDQYVEVTRRRRRPCPADMEEVRVETGNLFFNPVTASFDFISSENKNAPTVNKVLGNKVGGMKNPPLDHVVCKYPEKEKAPDGASDQKDESSKSGDSKDSGKTNTGTAEKRAAPRKRGLRKK